MIALLDTPPVIVEPVPTVGYMVTMVHQVTNEERFIYVWAWDEGDRSFLDALKQQRMALGLIGWDCCNPVPLDTPF